VKQKIGSDVQKWRENERNKEHDKIIQYFPHHGGNAHIYAHTRRKLATIPAFRGVFLQCPSRLKLSQEKA
jgi:surfactin synthase thioesterase subunit